VDNTAEPAPRERPKTTRRNAERFLQTSAGRFLRGGRSPAATAPKALWFSASGQESFQKRRLWKMIADTGPIVAWLNSEDQHHSWAQQFTVSRPWITLESCLAEAAWNLREPVKVAQLIELGLVVIAPLDARDWERIVEIASKYSDHDIDLVDFAVVRLSEKFRQEKIATVDREHFSLLRRFRGERLPLLLPD